MAMSPHARKMLREFNQQMETEKERDERLTLWKVRGAAFMWGAIFVIACFAFHKALA